MFFDTTFRFYLEVSRYILELIQSPRRIWIFRLFASSLVSNEEAQEVLTVGNVFSFDFRLLRWDLAKARKGTWRAVEKKDFPFLPK